MSHWKKSFPSKFLQVSDLDQPIVATITRVANENVGSGDQQELKPVVYFKETPKGCVLNLTRCEAIESITGDPDTDHWIRHRVRLFKGSTRYQGKRVPCIAIGPVTSDDDIDHAMPTLESEVL